MKKSLLLIPMLLLCTQSALSMKKKQGFSAPKSKQDLCKLAIELRQGFCAQYPNSFGCKTLQEVQKKYCKKN